MSHAHAMLETHPTGADLDHSTLAGCIEACYDCAQSCTACADACLGEEDVAMVRRCVRLCQDCADVCVATGRVLSRQTEYDAGMTRAVLDACAQACRICAEECERHAGHHEHCRVCAEACRHCERVCAELLVAIG